MSRSLSHKPEKVLSWKNERSYNKLKGDVDTDMIRTAREPRCESGTSSVAVTGGNRSEI